MRRAVSMKSASQAVLAIGLLAISLLGQVMATAAQVREHDSEWSAPSRARMRANPLANRTDTLAGGARLFDLRCANCHGQDAQGGTRAPDLTHPVVQAQSDGALFWKITSGNTRTGMPSFSFLPELERWQLVQYLRSTARH
jgi:mono/diheme cytochrome c family protein